MWVLECNDAGLALSEDGVLRLVSPGIASLEAGAVVVGEAAWRRWRLAPRQSHHRYWYALDQQPLDPPLGTARTAADLAWHQLGHLRQTVGDQALLLAVPASFERAQLALLLGLCRAAQLKAVGLVDSALAAAVGRARPGPVCHVDVQLHRVWLTRLEAAAELRRVSGLDLAKPGLTAVWDALATAIGEQFVRQTRFDPLHSAAVEQALYDRLPAWVRETDAVPSRTLELAAGGRVYRAQVARETLHAALAPLLQRIVTALRAEVTPQTQLLVSARAAEVPGLVAALQGLGAAQLEVLPPDAVAQGAERHAAAIRSDQAALPWVTRLPLAGLAESPAPEAAAAAPMRPIDTPTHLLIGARAHRLGGNARLLADWGLDWREDGCWLAAGARCNGVLLDRPRRLQGGDRIASAGGEAQLIVVDD